MAEPQVLIETRSSAAASRDGNGDVEMERDGQGGGDELELESPTGEAQAEADEVIEAALPEPKLSFLDYLRSPIVEIGIGEEDDAVTLTAHSALLSKSKFFVNALAQFSEDVTSRRIDMPSEDLTAMGCFLQFLYTGEYYPTLLPGNKFQSTVEDDGEQLLKHARVYTLATKLEMNDLAELAQAKVTQVHSTAQSEIEYARYIYCNTEKTDERIRRPIAKFWGQRSHVLRHEAEAEFKQLCIEFPEFAFDVLTQVLDSKERRGEKEKENEMRQSGRKRQRQV